MNGASLHDWRPVLKGLLEGRFPRVCTRCLMREDNPLAGEPCDALAEQIAARDTERGQL